MSLVLTNLTQKGSENSRFILKSRSKQFSQLSFPGRSSDRGGPVDQGRAARAKAHHGEAHGHLQGHPGHQLHQQGGPISRDQPNILLVNFYLFR